MTKRAFPLSDGDVSISEWTSMALYWMGTGRIPGFLNDLRLFADSSGRQVKVTSGGAFVRGVYYDNDQVEIVPLAVNSSGNPRRDLITLRVDISGVPSVVGVHVTEGVPAATPAKPAIVNTSTIWEFELGSVLVPNAAVTIAAGDVTVMPTWARPRGMPVHAKISTIGTIIGLGVASALHPEPGRYIVVWDAPFPDANYIVIPATQAAGYCAAVVFDGAQTPTQTEIRVYDAAGALVDTNWLLVTAYASAM